MNEPRPVSRNSELPHLSTFVKAAELGGFSAAASSLGISQAAVSQRMAALEGELRVSLFDRRSGRMSLTEAGQRLYVLARKIIDLHEQALSDLGGVRPPVAGDLRIAASSVPGECFLPALLTTFHRQHPQVRTSARVSNSRLVLDEIEKGRCALGFVGHDEGKPNLESRFIGSDCLVLVIASGHRWTTRKRVSLDTLSREPLIVREIGSGSRCALETALGRVGRSLATLNLALELGSNAAIKDAVRRDLGVAFLSRLAVQRELDAQELRVVAVRGLDLARKFYLVRHRHRPLPPTASLFLRFLDAHPFGSESHPGP